MFYSLKNMSLFDGCQGMSFSWIVNEDKWDFGFFIFTIVEPVEAGSNLHSWQPVVFCLYLGHCLRNKKENFWDVKKPQPTLFSFLLLDFVSLLLLSSVSFSRCLGLCFNELLFHQFFPLAVHKLLKTLSNISTVLFV